MSNALPVNVTRSNSVCQNYDLSWKIMAVGIVEQLGDYGAEAVMVLGRGNHNLENECCEGRLDISC